MGWKLFGSHITPQCMYCQYGCWNCDNSCILCRRKGVLLPDESCEAFDYDPLRRIPRRTPLLPAFDPDEFRL